MAPGTEGSQPLSVSADTDPSADDLTPPPGYWLVLGLLALILALFVASFLSTSFELHLAALWLSRAAMILVAIVALLFAFACALLYREEHVARAAKARAAAPTAGIG